MTLMEECDFCEAMLRASYSLEAPERLMNAKCICIIDDENVDNIFYHISYCPYRKRLEFLEETENRYMT